jgi:hypothetical protein
MTKPKFKRKKFLKKWDDKGVASTVGTIMAIMVILALLSLVTNHYVPVWMTDGESSHMEEALAQFGSFKTTLDNQMLLAEIQYHSNIEFNSMSSYTAIKLGSDGVPIFASPTHGELGMNSNRGIVSVETIYTINDVDYSISESSMGEIGLAVPNRYFVPQTIVYENGAIIRHQNDGEQMVADARFSVINKSSGSDFHYEAAVTLVWLFGAGSASGSGMEGISSKLFGMNVQSYENLNSSIYINHTTQYGEAWFEFYNHTLHNAYAPDPSLVDYSQTGGTTIVSTGFYSVTLTDLGDELYDLSIVLKNTNGCLKKLDLNVGYIDIAIGRQKGSYEV